MNKDTKSWQKRVEGEKEWYEFYFEPKVKVIQGTKYFNPLDFIKCKTVGLIQIHSAIIHKASFGVKLVGDGLFTQEKNVGLYVRTADCLPLTFYHKQKELLGLLHIGWRGTVLEFPKNFVLKMKEIYGIKPLEWEVVLGYCIKWEDYEVSEEIANLFNKFGSPCVYFKDGKYFLSLKEANINILKNLGIERIYLFPEIESPYELFYSYRKGDKERNITLTLIES
ncbi:MAG: polyphenol oxidase family protein [candidate division WOR-3 bacterium]